MAKETKAFENFNNAHATGDKPASQPAPATPVENKAEPAPADKAEKAADQSTSRAPEQPAEHEVKHRKSAADGDHDLHWAYVQGRAARQGAISKEEAPHDSESDEYKAWLKGWKFEDNA